MRPLFAVLPHKMVGKEALSAATEAEDKFVTVRYYPFFHGQVRYVKKDGLSCQSVHHADAERGKRVPVTGFGREEAECLPGECVERLFRGKLALLLGMPAQ